MYFRNFYQRNNDISSSISCVNGHLVSNNCYFHNPSSRDTSSPRLMLPDLYESKRIGISICKEVHGGEGIFVKVHVEPDTKLAFYNGISLALDLFNL